MAASSIQNPAAVAVESKSAKKKKAKAGRTESPAPSAAGVAAASAVASSEKAGSVAGDDAEPAYLRELAKNIRNANKKLANASKTDGLIAEHKDKTLDELVALKIINADQKAQHLKKPALVAQVAQLEEQYNQLKKIDADFRQRLVTERAELTKTLTDKFEHEKAQAVQAATAAAAADAQKTLHDSLLTLSQFLRLAAARRADDQDALADENLAIEGVLLQVYAGDETGVATMLKLVQGADEATKSVANEPLQTTFAVVKAAAAAHVVPSYQAEAAEETAAAPASAPAAGETDPTVAHASLTEIEAGTDTALVDSAAVLTNGHAAPADVAAVGSEETAPVAAAAAAAAEAPANASVDDAAANAAGESQWDTAGSNGVKDLGLSMSQEWVEVPRDPAETETGLAATPAAAANTQSWADEQPDAVPPPVINTSAPAAAPHGNANAAAADGNNASSDGFHQVQRHNRARSERDGWRGGGRGGGFRGRGRGGDGRGGRGGRGRGGGGGAAGHNGGNNGGFYRGGPRRNEEA